MTTTFDNGPVMTFQGIVNKEEDLIDGVWSMPNVGGLMCELLEQKFGFDLENIGTIRGNFEMNVPHEIYNPIA
jgi:hypothetical protein